MPTVSVDGGRLYYHEEGLGPAVLFLHGLVTDGRTWNDQVGRLSTFFRCVTYDRRGCSRSPIGNGAMPDLAVHAEDAAALIRALHLEPCFVVASSLGGVIGLELMRRSPELLRGVLLSEPALFSLAEGAGEELLARTASAVREALAARGPEGAVEAFAQVMDPASWPLIDERERNRMRANHPALMWAMGSPDPVVRPDDLARICVPCALVRADSSPPAFGLIVESLAELLPRSTLIPIKNSGHLVYVHQPEEFSRTVKVFAGIKTLHSGRVSSR